MTLTTTWGAPIRLNVQALAESDMARRENGQEPLIPYGTTVRISEPRGWFDRMAGLSSFSQIISWPYGVNSNTTHLTFRKGDPIAVKLQGALASRTAY